MLADLTIPSRTDLQDYAKHVGTSLKPTGFRPIYLALGSIVFLVTLAIMLLAVLGKPGDESD